MGKVLGTMTRNFMATDFSVIYHNKPGTTEAAFLCNHSFLKSCRSGNNLKGRARFIGIVDTAVSPDSVQYILLFFRRNCVGSPLRQRIRIVQIKLRHVYHGVDFSVLRIHNQYTDTVRLFGCHSLHRQLCCVRLNIHIHADTQIISADRFNSAFSCRLHLNAFGICHRENCS